MNGVAKVIDELGTIIIAKNVEIKLKQDEIDMLRRKIESIEAYLDAYDEMYDYQNEINRKNV